MFNKKEEEEREKEIVGWCDILKQYPNYHLCEETYKKLRKK